MIAAASVLLGMFEWLEQHWLEVVGTLLSGGALFFAWRNWDRSRRIVSVELQELRGEKKGHGEGAFG